MEGRSQAPSFINTQTHKREGGKERDVTLFFINVWTEGLVMVVRRGMVLWFF